MKKIILLFTCICFFYGRINAQQIPNGSFENWTTSGSTLELNGWESLNAYTANYPTYGTIRTTSVYDGTYALELKSGKYDLNPAGFPFIDTSAMVDLGVPATFGPSPGIPFAYRPLKLTFYYMYQPGTVPAGVNDTARVHVDFKKAGNKVGMGECKIYGNALTSYTYREIPITWYNGNTPDTMRMDIASSLITLLYSSEDAVITNQLGNTLYIDKLVFDYGTGLNSEEVPVAFNIYPNPANDIINIDRNNSREITLKIYNIIGALLKTETLKQNQQQSSISDLNNGVYLVEISSGSFKGTQKLIIQR